MKKLNKIVSVFGLAAVFFGLGYVNLNGHSVDGVDSVHVPLPDRDIH